MQSMHTDVHLACTFNFAAIGIEDNDVVFFNFKHSISGHAVSLCVCSEFGADNDWLRLFFVQPVAFEAAFVIAGIERVLHQAGNLLMSAILVIGPYADLHHDGEILLRHVGFS
jgi:hypothetical protein